MVTQAIRSGGFVSDISAVVKKEVTWKKKRSVRRKKSRG